MFSCTSERNPCCGPKMRRQVRARMRREAIGDVPQPTVYRGRIADDAHVETVEASGLEQAIDTERDRHRRIIVSLHIDIDRRRATCLSNGPVDRLRASWWSAPPASPAPRADRASVLTRSLLYVTAEPTCATVLRTAIPGRCQVNCIGCPARSRCERGDSDGSKAVRRKSSLHHR